MQQKLTAHSTFDEVIAYCGGQTIDMSILNEIDRWRFNHFSTEVPLGTSSFFDATLQVDITAAYQHYKTEYAKVTGSSFAVYFIWNLQKVVQRFPLLNTRYFNKTWYKFPELPIVSLKYLNTEKRFSYIILENFAQSEWGNFVGYYRNQVAYGESPDAYFQPELQFVICSYFSNLASLRFTAYTSATRSSHSGKPTFVIGERYLQNNRLYIPFYILMHHSNSDAQLMTQFVDCFKQELLS